MQPAPVLWRPWLPPTLAARGYRQDTVGTLSYIVVDEVVDDMATLAVTPWPDADTSGRLRFRTLDDIHHVGVTLAALREGFYERAARPRGRPPEVGDVFSARLAPAARRQLADASGDIEWDRPLLELVRGLVLDISDEARLVAKLAFYAAAVDVLPEDHASSRMLLADLGEEPEGDGLPAEVTRPAGPAVAVDWELPGELVGPADGDAFVEACTKDGGNTLVYFVLNVGDGDTQLLLLPADASGRRAVVVDVATVRKLPALLDELSAAGVLPPGGERERIPLVVATHPHDDHIGGLPDLLRSSYGRDIQEVWEPGYYHPSGVFVETMVELEERRERIRHVQPTSGLACYIGQVRLTVLAPGIGLRNRFDSYGVLINDSSLTLKVEYPVTRVADSPEREDPDGKRYHDRIYVRNDPWTLVLGADAQTTAWAQATLDFPQLHSHHDRELARELRRTHGRDALRAQVFKVPHHASKHGVNLELVSRIKPLLSLISCRAGGRYQFPHHLAVEAIREAQRPIATSGGVRPADHELGIHYTCARTVAGGEDTGRPLGSIALVLSPTRRTPPQLWRFGDEPTQRVSLSAGRRLRL